MKPWFSKVLSERERERERERGRERDRISKYSGRQGMASAGSKNLQERWSLKHSTYVKAYGLKMTMKAIPIIIFILLLPPLLLLLIIILRMMLLLLLLLLLMMMLMKTLKRIFKKSQSEKKQTIIPTNRLSKLAISTVV